MKIKTLQGFKQYELDQRALEKLGVTLSFKSFPTETYSDATAARSEKKQSFLDAGVKSKYGPINERNALGENDFAVLELIKQGKAGAYISKLNKYIGEVELPDGHVVAVMDWQKDPVNQSYEVSTVYLPKKGALKARAVDPSAHKFELTAVLMAILASVYDEQNEQGSFELVDTLKAIMDEKDLDVNVFKFSSILYYHRLFTNEVDLGPGIEANIVRMLDIDNLTEIGAADINILEQHGISNRQSVYFSEDAMAHSLESNSTANFLFELSSKGPNPLTLEEIENDSLLKTLAFETADAKQQLSTLFRNLTMNHRLPFLDIPPFVFRLVGAAGTGKSTIAAVAAKLAGFPYKPVVLTEQKFNEADISGQIIPRIKTDFSDDIARKIESANLSLNDGTVYVNTKQTVLQDFGLDYMDLIAAPEVAFKTIYGRDPESTEECSTENLFKKISELEVQRALREQKENKDTGENFMMVLTEIGKILLFGGVAEIQEYNMTPDKSECSYFYRIMQERLFALPNQLVLPVNPNARLVFTMNDSKGLNTPFPEAFETRSFAVQRFEPASPATMARQALKYFSSRGVQLKEKTVNQMALFIDECREHAQSREILSLRALINWITASLDEFTLSESCEMCVINMAAGLNNPRGLSAMKGMLDASPFVNAVLEATIVENERI